MFVTTAIVLLLEVLARMEGMQDEDFLGFFPYIGIFVHHPDLEVTALVHCCPKEEGECNWSVCSSRFNMNFETPILSCVSPSLDMNQARTQGTVVPFHTFDMLLHSPTVVPPLMPASPH